MKKKHAQKAVDEIADLAYDPETAHRHEDVLMRDFVEFVAQRDDDLGELARIILSTNDIPFVRWYG